MRSRRISPIDGNSVDIFLKNEIIIEEDGNGVLACEIHGEYLGNKKI